MEGDPALVVGLVDAGPVLHQERHHVHVVVDACLEERRKRKKRRVRPLLLTTATCPVCVCVSSPGLRQWEKPELEEGYKRLADCHMLAELLGNFGSRRAPKKCLRIAGLLEIPHSVVLLMEALTRGAATLYKNVRGGGGGGGSASRKASQKGRICLKSRRYSPIIPPRSVINQSAENNHTQTDHTLSLLR